MSRCTSSLFFALALLFSKNIFASENVPTYIGKHVSIPQDMVSINKIIEDFQAAIKNKDSKLLSTLVLNSNIFFASPSIPEDIVAVRDKRDVNFDGLRSGGYADFSRAIGTSKEALEEKFYNIKITQDKNVAWVMFDYEFVREGKSQNCGVETWQLMKVVGDRWKIVSVMWSVNRL